MTRYVALAALVAAVAVPAAAQGSTYPGQRPANNPLVEEAMGVAYAYLQARGIRPCPRELVDVLVADSLEGPDEEYALGRGELAGGCVDGRRAGVWLDVGLVADAQDRGLFGDPRYDLCDTLAHELAHTAQPVDTPAELVHAGGHPWEVLAKSAYRIPECERFNRDVNRRLRALNRRIGHAERTRVSARATRHRVRDAERRAQRRAVRVERRALHAERRQRHVEPGE